MRLRPFELIQPDTVAEAVDVPFDAAGIVRGAPARRREAVDRQAAVGFGEGQLCRGEITFRAY